MLHWISDIAKQQIMQLLVQWPGALDEGMSPSLHHTEGGQRSNAGTSIKALEFKMSNIAGKTLLRGRQEAGQPALAVEEWSMRVATQLPGEITAPRNTLRGHPQPWRTRPVPQDEGPLGASCRPVPGATYSRTAALDAAKAAAANQSGKSGVSSSTAELSPGQWDARLRTTQTVCGHRGSQTPNWKPLAQEDLTATGSVNPGYWQPGTTKFRTPGTVTWDEMMHAMNGQAAEPTCSTAAIARVEWEGRLDAAGMGAPLN